MSKPKEPDRRQQPAEGERHDSAAGRETGRAADSVPIIAGKFENLPTMFGRYRVERLLGRGAMGAVYLARDTQLDRAVALKVPKVSASGSKRLLARLEIEAKAAARLDHPCLCQVFDAGAVGEQCFIAMQYIEGETLRSQLKREGKSVVEAVSLIVQLSEGLLEAHALGIIHRDLKPENIMINRRGTPVIMDFGLAKISTITTNAAATQAGTILGTPSYMSPEQARGDASKIDHSCDIYALGVIFFELLTGELPFSGSAMQILGQKTLRMPASPLTIRPGLPPTVAAICHKMIAKDKSDRYQNLKDVVSDLQTADSIRTLPLPASSMVESAAADVVIPPIVDVSSKLDRATVSVQQGKRVTANASSPSDTQPRTWLQKLQAWWSDQPPVLKWSAVYGTAAVSIALAVIIFIRTPDGFVKVEIEDPSLAMRFDGEREIRFDDRGTTIRVTPTSKHTFEILHNGVIIESASEEFSIKRGRTRLVTLKLVDGNVVLDGKLILEKAKVAATRGKVEETGNTGWHGWPTEAPKPAIAPFNASQAKALQEAWAKYLKVDVQHTNPMGMKFVLIPPGEFMMGSTPEEVTRHLKDAGNDAQWQQSVQSAAPRHHVTLTQPIYLGIHEVTQAEYEKVMGAGRNPSHFAATGQGKDAVVAIDTTRHPVEMISWNEAVEFCTKLSQPENLTPAYSPSGAPITPLNGTGYRLPTEAEWEFACRAGTSTDYWTGANNTDLRQVAWCDQNSKSRTHAVGQLKANPFGLHDVYGNVFEWVQDVWNPTYYDRFKEASAVDPRGPAPAGSQHVVRGGSWSDRMSLFSRSAQRTTVLGPPRDWNVGFRVALPITAVGASLPQLVAASPDVKLADQPLPPDAVDLLKPKGVTSTPDSQAEPVPFSMKSLWSITSKLPEEYDIRLTATRRSGAHALCIGLPISGSRGVVLFDISEAPFSGLEKIDGLLIGLNSSYTRGRQLVDGVPAKILMQVRYDGILAQVDDQTVFDWKGEPERLTDPWRDVPDTGWLFLTTANATQYDISECWLIPHHRPPTDLGKKDSPQPFQPSRPESLAVTQSGKFQIVNDELVTEGTDPRVEENRLIFGDPAWKDYDLKVETVIDQFMMHGIIFRNCDANGQRRHWTFELHGWGGPHVDLKAISPGDDEWHNASRRYLANVLPGELGTWFAVEIRVRGDQVTVSVDGKVLASGRHANLSHGRIGVITHGKGKARWRNFEARDVDGTVLWQGLPKLNDADAATKDPAAAINKRIPEDLKHFIADQGPFAGKLAGEGKELIPGIKFHWCPPGVVTMGSPANEFDRVGDEALTSVLLTRGFWMGETEVTQGQWKAVMETEPWKNQSYMVEGPDHAASYISHGEGASGVIEANSASEFCRRLTERARKSGSLPAGWKFALPSEAQWEHACRAGTELKYYFGNDVSQLGDYAWWGGLVGNGNAQDEAGAHRVGLKKPNAWGLHDMHGNVWEWTSSWYEAQRTSGVDPVSKPGSSERCLRGGAWDNVERHCRSANRGKDRPNFRGFYVGFRVAAVPSDQ